MRGWRTGASFTLAAILVQATARSPRALVRCRWGLWAEATAAVEFTLAEPQLWSLEQPQLYTAVIELERGGRVVDRFEQPFGIRTIRYDANQGFALNGEPLKVQGASNHQDHAGVGIANGESEVAAGCLKLGKCWTRTALNCG